MTFGEFIKLRRQQRGFTLRAFANEIKIAPAYMSDIEKGKRNAPNQEILNKMINALKLDDIETKELIDLAAQSKEEVADDIASYVNENANVRVALRRAKELKLGDDEWLKIIEEMVNKEK